MSEDLIPVLAEMRLYYHVLMECAENAMPGSKAERKFTEYYAALDQAIARMSQEPVKPSRTLSPEGNWWENCGACDSVLLKWYTYCPGCGRKVKWNEAD